MRHKNQLNSPSASKGNTSKKKAPVPKSETGKGINPRRLKWFLGHSVFLEENGPPHVFHVAAWSMFGFIIFCLIWASVVTIDEAATASGEVIPAGAVKVVQHFEGGIVSEILVSEGDRVKKDQPVMILQQASVTAELQRLKAEETTLALKAARLRALLTGRNLDLGAYVGKAPKLENEVKSILTTQRIDWANRMKTFKDQIEDGENEVKNLTERKKLLAKDFELVSRELNVRIKLMEKGHTTRRAIFDQRRTFNKVKGEMLENERRIAIVQDKINQARNRLRELQSRLKSETIAEIGEVMGSLNKVRETLSGMKERVQRLRIVSPVTGLVKHIPNRTSGGVIAPGATVMEIVPSDVPLIVEARIKPKDIGRIKSGQEARIRLTAYDFSRYGDIPGTLKGISASTFLSEDGIPYYKAKINLNRPEGHQPHKLPILPGMTADVLIRTGERSIWDYMMAPIYRGLGTAFLES